MWEQIKSFFSWLFGLSSDEEENQTNIIEEDIPEDASDLGEVEVLEIEEPTAEEMAARREAQAKSRSIIIGEVIDVDESPAPEPVKITNPRFFWLLDNGHGRLQKGKRSPLFEDGTQLQEWEFNRDIVRRIIPQLEEAGVQFMNVVPEDEVGSFLKERVARANAASSPLFGTNNRIFLSIHANALGMGDWVDGANGIEVWHYPGNLTGKKLASAFQRALMTELPEWKDRGIKSHSIGSSRIFYVLRNTAMPAVLTENGFYTDKKEATLLKKPEIRQKIADAHVNAILKIEKEGYDNIDIYRPNMVVGG